MKKLILLTLFLLPLLTFSQFQLGSDINGEASNDKSGYSVSIDSDGSHVAIGAYYNDGTASNAGHVRVYQYSWDGSAWTQVGNDIDGEAASDNSGYSVSIDSDGSHVAIGAYNNDGGGSDSGHVRIYSWNGSAWTQVGNDIDGEALGDNSGGSVSIDSDGSHVAIGAYNNDGNGSNAGHVRIYEYSSGSWSQVGNDIDGEASDDRSGYSVSIDSDGSHVAIGAYNNDGGGSNSGHVRVYQYSGGSWSKLGGDINGEASADRSGYSVSIDSDGSHVAIGAYTNDGTASNAGHVRIYEYSSGSWSQVGSDIDGEAESDGSGISVSIDSSGSNVAIGAYNNDGGGSNSGHVRVYDLGIPVINSVSLAADNSTIAVTFSSAVYNTNAGSGALEVSDFTLSISGGTATLSSSTPSSISASGNVYTLGISLSGTTNGSETLTVVPSSASAIYNAVGTAVSTSQSNNTVSLNNIAPTFDSVRLSADNASVAITASETLYTTTGGSGALVAADFAFSISGGTATLSSTTPASISTSGLVITLGIGLSGTPDGDEILRVNPASATSIYDSGDTALSSTSIMATTGAGLRLFPNTLTAASLTSSGATTAGSLTVDSVVIDGTTIGHSSDSDLMTLASGSLTVAGDVTISSDARLKSNIVALGPTLISLLQLEAKSYTMKNDTEQKQKIGLLAQEVQKVFPELVSEDNNGMLAVNYQALVPVLINALKEQENNYNELEKSLEILEKEILKNK
ncbi:MAG: tail fiber domain-containing protein [Flavobacteriaceae bacterium]